MSQPVFPVCKGLQKPLEFMGIRGRFLIYGAMTVGFSFLGFFAGSFIGKTGGLIIMISIIATGLITIFIKQKSGLHNKKRHKGIFIYKTLKKN